MLNPLHSPPSSPRASQTDSTPGDARGFWKEDLVCACQNDAAEITSKNLCINNEGMYEGPGYDTWYEGHNNKAVCKSAKLCRMYPDEEGFQNRLKMC
ncbi:hypothetical protein PG994_012938 [Apiospora phragmitis]|uniref:Uncharacterized protein n=1 Tax=Apiospora phragmitis TaxID=2905665 RepID=A0ABR1T8Y7_9PEZI